MNKLENKINKKLNKIMFEWWLVLKILCYIYYLINIFMKKINK